MISVDYTESLENASSQILGRLRTTLFRLWYTRCNTPLFYDVHFLPATSKRIPCNYESLRVQSVVKQSRYRKIKWKSCCFVVCIFYKEFSWWAEGGEGEVARVFIIALQRRRGMMSLFVMENKLRCWFAPPGESLHAAELSTITLLWRGDLIPGETLSETYSPIGGRFKKRNSEEKRP